MKQPIKFAMVLASLSALGVHAEVDFYGKANVSSELVSRGAEDFTQLSSNASRVGIKGNEAINDGLSVVYQAEYQVEFDDSDTFSQRNIYAGLKGHFGTVIAGHFDTPLKKSQHKVDLFPDLPGDIKNVITVNENRASNSVMYVSPSIGPGITVYADLISSESEAVDDAGSFAVTYSSDSLYAALATDVNVETENSSALRAVVQYTLNALQFGLLLEQYEIDGSDAETGAMASAQYRLDDQWTLKGQVGLSDIVAEGGESLSVGADYKWSKTVKNFAYYTRHSADDATAFDNDYLGVGLEVKF